MRTTVTLDPDTIALVRRQMRERGVTFKQAVNDSIRAGLTRQAPGRAFRTPTADLGVPTVDLDAALSLAGDLEDAEIVRKMRLRK